MACSSGARLVAYAAALAIGAIAAALLVPLGTLLGTGGLWASPPGDTALTLTGHLAFQSDPWRWPLLATDMLFWPRRVSVAMQDSNAAFSLLAKVVSRTLGSPPINLLGVWLGLCVVLQPVAAVYALRGVLCGRPEAAVAVAVLAVLSPAWLIRVAHLNLMGQFVVLVALGLTLRLLAGSVRHGWVKAACLLTAGILFHPYLFVIAMALLAAVPAEATLHRRPAALRLWASWLLACLAPLLLFRVLSGDLGGGAPGFGLFSMNLLSPLWPQVSGLFGPKLPVLDATGGQYEGFNYLGAGVLFLLAMAGVALAATRRAPCVPRGLLLSLAGLTMLALSNRIYAGHTLVLDLGAKPWEQLFAPVRASGRFFWPVGYALLIGAAAVVATRLPRWASTALLVGAVALQLADAAPLRHRATGYFAGDNAAAPDGVPLPPGTTLVSLAPPSMCTTDVRTLGLSGSLLLRAARAGVRLGDAFLARPPPGFLCEKAWSDALEAPLMPGEARVFTEAAALAVLHLENLGVGAQCAPMDAGAVCSRGPASTAEEDLPPTRTLARVKANSAAIAGTALRPLLSLGWRMDTEGIAWSNGPYATLLFALDQPPPASGVQVALHFAVVGTKASKTRTILLRAGLQEARQVSAREGEPVSVTLTLTAEEAASGVVRVAFDLTPDADANKRLRIVPVRLTSVDLMPVPDRHPQYSN